MTRLSILGLVHALCLVLTQMVVAQGSPNAIELRRVAIDANALLALEVGDAMPRDLAEEMGAGQLLERTLAASHGATYLRFEHPKNPLRWSDVLVRGSRVTACLRDGTGDWVSVRTIDDGTMIRELRSRRDVGACGAEEHGADGDGDGAQAAGAGSQNFGANCDDGSVVDLLVYVTVQAALEMGGMDAAIDEVVLAETISNVAYSNTGIPMRIRIVGVYLSGYPVVDGDKMTTDRNRLQAVSDGWLDEAHAARDLLGADLVTLWRVPDPTIYPGGNGVAGTSFILDPSIVDPATSGFTIMDWSEAVSNLTFPHELGHNMGCCHASGDTGTGPCGWFGFSRGWRFTGSSNTQWRTIMAYAPGTRITYFSDPLTSFDGVPTGVAGPAGANNTLTISTTRALVSIYRCSIIPDNDDCQDATLLVEGSSLSVSNDHATTELGGGFATCAGSDLNDVWAKFTAPANGTAFLQLCAGAATTQTTISVYEDNCTGDRIACVSEDAGSTCESPFSSALSLPVLAGRTYLVRLSCLGAMNGDVFNGLLLYGFTPTAECASAAGSCFSAHATHGCSNAACCAMVSAFDPYCGATQWDSVCVDHANTICADCGDGTMSCFVVHSSTGCADPGCCANVTAVDSFCGLVEWDAVCAGIALIECGNCGDPNAGSCFSAHLNAGCNDEACCVAVCETDIFCCDTRWDATCAQAAPALCGGCGGGVGSCFVMHATAACDDPVCCASVCAVDPTCCSTNWDAGCVDQAMISCGGCGTAASGSCYFAHQTPGCRDSACCTIICWEDPFCCEDHWDPGCATRAYQVCGSIADLNHDASVNAADLAILLNNWSASGVGDLNNDGVVNAADLSILLNAWTG